ncbi:MAG: succinate-semialdehyde dehydrogenase [Marmoricola sp.]|jgi:succinate-semialdehyde dehydrogenase/glutarate-semialdehyde dehydrogenase|nr:succinate-semialdehyde dehydrogenase [Marmoricola sp.]
MTETTFDVLNPATGQLIERVADGTVQDATEAVHAAAAAFASWAVTPARMRAEILRRCYDLMVRDTDALACLIATENGKSVQDARAEVTYAAEFFRWFSEEAVRGEGTYGDAPGGGAKTLVTHVPVGVAALITPWNFPAAMATRKIAPALAAGCTVVLKPAEETPLTALALARLLQEAGVPEGVVNVVPTTDAPSVVSAWLKDERVRKISFTGSTGVGRILMRQAADRIVNASMELGGNAPFVITADADIDEAVAGAMIAKFRGGGQACTAANRFYVHEDVIDEFVEKFSAAVEALEVGPSSNHENQIGPVISQKARAGIAELVKTAIADGARVAVQGTVPDTGWFYPPTVLVDVPVRAHILSKEIFGPVAPIVSWTDEAEMLKSANDTEFGLAAYVYAGRLQDALRIAEQLDAGMVGINRGIISDPSAPFGGIKQSGIGREGAHEGIREYQETRYFSVDWS